MFLTRRRGIVPVVLAAAVAVMATPAYSSAPQPLKRADLRWLDRVTFGVDAEMVARFRELGRKKFLDEQLHASAADAPALAQAIDALSTIKMPPDARLRAIRAENQRINALTDADEKQKARQALNQLNNQAVYETTKRQLMRDLSSTSQLRELMTWFWMNHFSVFSGKANVRWELPAYEDTVRAHAFGKFSDLVITTAESPAMLEYLDNAQSAVNRINENYARELMELHVLGVSGGASGSTYTQQDVQELARVLTGAGINPNEAPPRLPPDRQALYVKRGLFEFNPARHDAGAATVLGHEISGRGLDEIEDAIVMLCRQPAAARFISRQLATYFVADDPPAKLIDRMASTFTRTDGSIADVLRTMFLDDDFAKALESDRPATEKFKDPMAFVVSSLRLAYDGKTLTNFHPIVNWLQQLGEPLYGRVTPDGYPLTEPAWTSSGQLIKRFEIARAIGGGNAGLFNNDDNSPGPVTGFPLLTTRFYYDAIEPLLSPTTRTALTRASSQQEWNLVLLASPDWMER